MSNGFPDVPIAPGVPTLPRAPGALITDIVQLTEDVFSALSIFSPFGSQWGLFLDGVPALVADSVISFEYKQDWTLSTYPVEQGGFQSYDKVQLPFDVRIRMSVGGTVFDRQAFLTNVDFVANSLLLYDAVTPEATYTSVNVTHYDYNRTATNGVGLLVVDLWLLEVRQSVTTTFTNTASPSAASPQSGGTVSLEDPTLPSQTLVQNAIMTGQTSGGLTQPGGSLALSTSPLGGVPLFPPNGGSIW